MMRDMKVEERIPVFQSSGFVYVSNAYGTFIEQQVFNPVMMPLVLLTSDYPVSEAVS